MPSIETIEAVLDIRTEEELRNEQLFNQLANELNHLIQHDFSKLITILYRIDVNESKLRELLRANPDKDSGRIIAALLLERQMQKIRLKKEFNQNNSPADDEEKW